MCNISNELFVLFFLAVICFGYECPEKNFKLNNSECYPWLTCSEISKIKIIKRLGGGYVKNAYLAEWRDYSVVLLKLTNLEFIDDYLYGLNILKELHKSPYIVQLIGFCNNTIITEYHKYGDARNILEVLLNNGFTTISKRVELCLNYAQILEFLHSSPIGTLVSCDTNSLHKLLSQFLISDGIKLVLNDVDALPIVKNNSLILCGSRPITGNFAAPEQKSNGDELPIGYDEKTDIWKIPSVCSFLLKDHEQKEVVLYELFDIHKKCKTTNPKFRPKASEVVVVYKSVLEGLLSNDEL